jgi:hypothetical protein
MLSAVECDRELARKTAASGQGRRSAVTYDLQVGMGSDLLKNVETMRALS